MTATAALHAGAVVILGMLLAGAAVGLVNGLLYVKGRVPHPFIVTFAMCPWSRRWTPVMPSTSCLECVQYFGVDQVWSVPVAVRDEALDESRCGVMGGERFEHGRGVDDKQRVQARSRPSRTAATIAALGAPPARERARASRSATGGCSATRSSSPRA
jgi:hypothetical protein